MKFSLSKDGNKNITKNFLIREYACRDGTDEILIEIELASLLQNIRDAFNSPLTITSAYRTESHNLKVGGSSGSLHRTGEAADIKVSKVPCNIVAQYLDSKYPNSLGIELAEDDSYLHVDIRKNRWRAWKKNDGSVVTVNKFYPK